MLDKRKLSRINDRPRGRGSAVYAALGTLVVAAAAAFLISYTVAAMAFLAGVLGVFLLYKRDIEARTTRLTYDLDDAPQHAEQRSRMASRAAKSRAGRGEIRDLKRQLENLAERVVTGDLQPYPASVAGQLIGVRLRLLEHERRAKETEELEARLEELERERGRGRWTARGG